MASHELPIHITEFIQRFVTQTNKLAFGGDSVTWHPVSNFRSLGNEEAIYVLGLRLGVQYHRMTSKIIYIGSTASLSARIRSYAYGGHNHRLDLLRRRFPGGLECAFYPLPQFDATWRRAIEDAALQAAFEALGCYPLCNMAPIDSKLRDVFRGIVSISACEALPFPQSISSLNCGDGVLENYPLVRQATSHLSGHCTEDSVPQIQRVPYHEEISPEEAERLSQERQAQNEFDSLTWFHQEHVATWSEQKMSRIIAICKQLILTKPYKGSRVVTFESPSRTVPTPDTWGEVAVLKAREIAGTFYPATRLWLKVRYQKVLLGQAIHEPKFYRGEDKSDLPQTKERTRIWDDAGWYQEFEAIDGVLPEDFHVTQIDILALPTSTASDARVESAITLLKAAREFDLAEANREAEWEMQMAREQSKYDKAKHLLDERIESLYRAAAGT